MKCPLCVDGVLGIVHADGQVPEPLFCQECRGEGVVTSLAEGTPYIEDYRRVPSDGFDASYQYAVAFK